MHKQIKKILYKFNSGARFVNKSDTKFGLAQKAQNFTR